MAEVKFDVNDEKLRNEFLTSTLPLVIDELDPTASARWGKMSVQHMSEHLLFSFEISTGKLTMECKTPEKLLPRVKGFLHNNMEMPHNFRNPLLPDNPAELRYPDLDTAKKALIDEIRSFLELYKMNPEIVFTHPVFGPLGKEDWERIHFKHCCHHLLQFELITGLSAEDGTVNP
jgi:hypothetical protein